MTGARILVVEDDVTMQHLLNAQLVARGFQIMTVDNGRSAILAVADFEPQLLLLDIGIPGIDDLEFCRQIREWSPVPIIIVSSLDAPQTKAGALDLGADDYITKPFYMGELIARMRAVLRRTTELGNARQAIVQLGDLTIDVMRREVYCDDKPLHMTKTEFDLLREFLTNMDRILTYQHLLANVWGAGSDDPRLVQVHVCNLRRKLETHTGGSRYIVALPGIGYRFTLG